MAKKIIKPVMSAEQAVKSIEDESTIMVGGFNYGGIPYTLVDAVIDANIKELTLICNDTAYEDVGHGKLIKNGRIKKVIASHVGLNKATQALFNEKKLELELVPQGSLVERIRAGGYGLGGILTPTGVGTAAEEGKRVIEVEGKKYILELPLRADVALIRAYKADRYGNLVYYGTNRNFNPAMATAAGIVIVEVDAILEVGSLDPNRIVTPGILVDILVFKGDSYYASRT
ncbi:MAG TPA: CoA transferase subunit A [Spirochaetales bacterium]|nr:CoA transferase subunit A [Spirochaetales bacterium]